MLRPPRAASMLQKLGDDVRGTVLHLGKIFKDPFFDAGQAPQGKRLQAGSSIRRWNPAAGTDEIVWDPFNFLDPLTERTNASNTISPIPENGVGVLASAENSPARAFGGSPQLAVLPVKNR